MGKQIKIYEVNGNNKNKKEITMDNNYLFEIYSTYKDEAIENIAKNIIKINMPTEKDIALKLLKYGIEIEEKKYCRLLTTVGAMKHEDVELDIKGSYYFIVEEDKKFKKTLEDIASLGKLETLKGKEICVNKDIVSRLSLLLSSGDLVYFADNIPKWTSLKEARYTFADNYLEFAEKEIGGKSILDLEKFKLIPKLQQMVEHVTMDGQGIAMPWVMNTIGKQLNRKEELFMIGFRTLGTACKGSLLSFDWKNYFRHYLKLGNDVKIIVKDQWDNDVDLMDVDIIVNESLMKWGKLFTSMNEINERKKNYTKYENLLNSMIITKVDNKPNEFSFLNYQILSNTVLTPKELNKLAEKNINTYRDIINEDIDKTLIMLGDCSNEKELTASTKIHQALQLDEKLIKIQSSKYLVDELINKKVHELAGGRIQTRCWYNGICNDILSYFDSLISVEYTKNNKAMIIKKSVNGLDLDTCYQPHEYGKRVLARCPLNSADELIKTELKQNKAYDYLFDKYPKDILFVPLNNYLMRMSGADTDFDIVLTIDNEDIYNSVIEDIDPSGVIWHFRNQFDGKAKKIEYNETNLCEAVLDVVGNSIGQLANIGARVSTKIQELPYKLKDNTYKSYNDLYEKYKKGTSVFIESELKNGGMIDYTKIEENEIKAFMWDNFQKYKIYSYFTTYMQMIAIDSVKTGIFISKDGNEMVRVESIKKKRKPLYIYHAKYKTENRTVDYNDVAYSNSSLNNFCCKVNRELGYSARVKKKKEYDPNQLYNVLKKNNNSEVKNELVDKIVDFIEEYNKKRSEASIYINGIYKEMNKLYLRTEINKIKRNRNIELIREIAKKVYGDEFGEKSKDICKDVRSELNKDSLKSPEELENMLIVAKEERDIVFTKIDVELHKVADLIKGNYSYKEILIAINKTRDSKGHRVKSRIIFEFFFEEFKAHMIENCKGIGNVYIETKEGDIEFMYNRYSKKQINIADVNLTDKELLKKKIKTGEVIQLRIGNLTYIDLSTNKIKVDNECIYIEDKKLGDLFGEYRGIVEDGVYEVKYDYKNNKNQDYKKAKSMNIFINS